MQGKRGRSISELPARFASAKIPFRKSLSPKRRMHTDGLRETGRWQVPRARQRRATALRKIEGLGEGM